MQHLNFCTPFQFGFFRICFGLYLFVHFLYLVPYADEVFSREGMLPDASLNFAYQYFPNILSLIDTPPFITGFVIGLAFLAVAFTLGMARRFVSLFIWYGWACLYNRNNLIQDPALFFIGWLLLACSVIPHGEPLAIGERRKLDWTLTPLIFYGAWVIMALAYSISGIDKLFNSPSWRTGMAIQNVLESPIARDWWLRDISLLFPQTVLQFITWAILSLEIACVPLSLFMRTRFLIWCALSAIHVVIVFLIDIPDISIGMLMFHLFTLDARWFQPGPATSVKPIVFVDGTCVLCQGFVRFLLTEDQGRVFRIASFQGATAKDELSQELRECPQTIVLKDELGVQMRTDAVFKILTAIGGIWRIWAVFRFIPRSLRDHAYELIARHRYAWFGRTLVCQLFDHAVEGRILP